MNLPSTFKAVRRRGHAPLFALLLGACVMVAQAERGPQYPLAESEDVAPRAGLKPCSERLQPARAARLNPNAHVGRQVKSSFGAVRSVGVEENVRILPTSGRMAAFLRVRYPEGSVSFSAAGKGRPLGGASFYAPFTRKKALCVHYRVRFPEGFDFVKGGKLPGLYGGQAPSGGEKVTGSNGWTVRLMWREDGQGELYEYVVNKDKEFGLSVGRGTFQFRPGRWTAVDLEVVVNDPGRRNGIARLWIDGRAVIEQDDIVYTTRKADADKGFFFSTFFGGSDGSWASPKDQHADFAEFRMYEGRGR